MKLYGSVSPPPLIISRHPPSFESIVDRVCLVCCQMEVVQGTTYSLDGFSKQQLGDSRRQYSWERGQIDYLGIDSFDNILSQLDAKLH